MRYKIPSDWNGQTWRCIQIDFPDSFEWLALLNGWLSDLKRGKVWDERTGNIKDTQAIMWDMWERNRTLRPCVTCEDMPRASAGNSEESECDDMPCTNLAEKIRFDDDTGELQVYNDCCCQWETIGTIASAAVPALPADPLNNPDNPIPLTYYACGKAGAVVDLIYLMAAEVWDEIDNVPLQWVSHVESGTGIDGENTYIVSAVSQAILMAAADYEESEVIRDEDKAWAKMQLATVLEDNADAITRDQWNDFRATMRAHWGIDILMRNFWDYVILAAGYKNAKNASLLGATDDTAVCTELPAGIVDPTSAWGLTWAHFWDLTRGELPANIELQPDSYFTEYVGVRATYDGNGYSKVWLYLPFEVEQGTITRAWAMYKTVPATDYINLGFNFGTADNNLLYYGYVDTDPSGGGTFVCDHAVNEPITGVDNHISFGVESDIPAPNTADRVPVLLAFAIGGTGSDPFPSL